MNPKPTLFCLFVLVFFVLPLQAQQPASQALKMFRSKAYQEMLTTRLKAQLKSQWHGEQINSMTDGLLHNPTFREALGVTEEQFSRIQGSMVSMQSPEVQEMGELMQSGKIFGDNPDLEAEKRYFELQTKMSEAHTAQRLKAVDEVLTEEQKRKAQEYQLATMSQSPFLPLDSLQILGISDEQKKQMLAIRKELEPQFDQIADGYSETHSELIRETHLQTKEDGPATETKFAASAEFAKRMKEIQTQSNILATQLKTKMFDVLTDEQWEKLQSLVDNPPEHVKKMRAAVQKRLGQSQSAENKADSRNFMDAWKPGDAIPEEYRNKRAKKAFPMKK